MSTQTLHPLVNAALNAMENGDQQRWFDLFAADTVMTDDGDERDFTEWSIGELFSGDRAYLMSIDRVEDDGLTLYGLFHSDRWGNFGTFMTFQIRDNKITRLDVGQI